MDLLFGTSGFQYKPWRGTLYPRAEKDPDMLATYARVLATVELNNTYYRLPKPGTMAKWASEVPENFRFAVKAPHWLAPVSKASGRSAVDQLGEHLEQLGDKLATVLFQSPPNVQRDAAKLREFIALLPAHWPVCFDLRHPSWQDPEVLALLSARGAASCVVDSDEPPRPWTASGSFGYVRLRRSTYTDDELLATLERVRAQPWHAAYLYFKHEDEAPALVARFAALSGAAIALPGLVEAAAAPPVVRTPGPARVRVSKVRPKLTVSSSRRVVAAKAKAGAKRAGNVSPPVRKSATARSKRAR
jgi:uncharacterized protein YecE (DUF72 family)